MSNAKHREHSKTYPPLVAHPVSLFLVLGTYAKTSSWWSNPLCLGWARPPPPPPALLPPPPPPCCWETDTGPALAPTTSSRRSRKVLVLLVYSRAVEVRHSCRTLLSRGDLRAFKGIVGGVCVLSIMKENQCILTFGAARARMQILCECVKNNQLCITGRYHSLLDTFEELFRCLYRLPAV